MEESNAALRRAVRQRLDSTMTPVEPDVLRPVTPCNVTDEVSSHVTFQYDADTMNAARDFVTAREEFEKLVLPESVTIDEAGSSAFLDVLDRIRHLHRSKSADYGSDVDPLANIRSGAEFVGIEAWRGCMVRICDKMQRLKTYCHTGRLVHEGVEDTLMDLASYAVIALVLFNEERDNTDHERSGAT